VEWSAPRGGHITTERASEPKFTTGLSLFDGLFGPFLPGSIYLLVGRTGLTFSLIDRLVVSSAQRGMSTYYMDGGYRADPFAMARVLRMQRADPRRALEKVMIARAFTAYQMDTLVTEGLKQVQPPPDLLIVSSLDSLLSDPEVGLDEARGMAKNCMEALREAASGGTCVVMAVMGGPRESELFPVLTQHCTGWASFKNRPGNRVRVVTRGGAWTDIAPMHPFQTMLEEFSAPYEPYATEVV